MRDPRLLDGTSYHILLRNLWRLLATGKTMAEARTVILRYAGLSTFPPRPSSGSSTIDPLHRQTRTIH